MSKESVNTANIHTERRVSSISVENAKRKSAETVTYIKTGVAGQGEQTEVSIYKKITKISGRGDFEERVAVKCQRPEWERFSASLEIEDSILETLKGKLTEAAFDYIVRYKGKETIDDALSLVFEYIDGSDTGRFIENKSVSEKQVAMWTRDTLIGLVIIHSVNVIHRDLKPTNVMLIDKEGQRAKLVDFRSAGQLEGPERLALSRGSFKYRSPEGHLCNMVTDKADLFSLGLTIYEQLSGQKAYYPHTDEDVRDIRILDRILNSEPDYDLESLKKVSPEALGYIKQLLVKDPTKRPDSREALDNTWFKKLGIDSIIKPGDSWWLKESTIKELEKEMKKCEKEKKATKDKEEEKLTNSSTRPHTIDGTKKGLRERRAFIRTAAFDRPSRFLEKKQASASDTTRVQ